jgi:hypothetical protein
VVDVPASVVALRDFPVGRGPAVRLQVSDLRVVDFQAVLELDQAVDLAAVLVEALVSVAARADRPARPTIRKDASTN